MELSPAPLHGGPEGCYRVRLARRWLDTDDGRPRFFDQDGLARLAAQYAFCNLEPPAPAPDIPYPSRVTGRREVDGWPHYYGTWTRTPPVLGYEGVWLVGVSLDGKVQFVPVDDVTIAKEQRRGRG